MGDDDDEDNNTPFSFEEILALQEKDEEPIRLAVEEVLLPSLQGEALTFGRLIVDQCCAYNLYAATEAVSSFLNRFSVRNPGLQLHIDQSGVWASGSQVFGLEDLALEVARFTGLWTQDGGSPVMTPSLVVRWVTIALKYQPRLLSHFIAVEVDGIIGRFLLTKVAVKDRIDDCRQRWRRSPSKQS